MNLPKQRGAWGLASLVEIHTEAELELALTAGAEVVGINNRDLKNLPHGYRDYLPPENLPIPTDKIVVSESGINTHSDVMKLEAAGINAILVGESLMRSPNIGNKVRELLGNKPG